ESKLLKKTPTPSMNLWTRKHLRERKTPRHKCTSLPAIVYCQTSGDAHVSECNLSHLYSRRIIQSHVDPRPQKPPRSVRTISNRRETASWTASGDIPKFMPTSRRGSRTYSMK